MSATTMDETNPTTIAGAIGALAAAILALVGVVRGVLSAGKRKKEGLTLQQLVERVEARGARLEEKFDRFDGRVDTLSENFGQLRVETTQFRVETTRRMDRLEQDVLSLQKLHTMSEALAAANERLRVAEHEIERLRDWKHGRDNREHAELLKEKLAELKTGAPESK